MMNKAVKREMVKLLEGSYCTAYKVRRRPILCHPACPTVVSQCVPQRCARPVGGPHDGTSSPPSQVASLGAEHPHLIHHMIHLARHVCAYKYMRVY